MVRLWHVGLYMLQLVDSKHLFLKNQPWWKALDAEKSGIDEVCKVLAHLYSPPQAQYISVCKDGNFLSSNMSSDSQLQPVLKLGCCFQMEHGGLPNDVASIAVVFRKQSILVHAFPITPERCTSSDYKETTCINTWSLYIFRLRSFARRYGRRNIMLGKEQKLK